MKKTIVLSRAVGSTFTAPAVRGGPGPLGAPGLKRKKMKKEKKEKKEKKKKKKKRGGRILKAPGRGL